jgi:thiol-disulfide isomerase/thioredoxin
MQRFRIAFGAILAALAVGSSSTSTTLAKVSSRLDAAHRSRARTRSSAARERPSTDRTPAASADEALPTTGRRPNFAAIDGWVNSTPLTMQELRGKVVLVDFWTYSCINCLRTLPHLEAWDRMYRKAGLVIVGVHTPEFAFEHVPLERALGREAARRPLPGRDRQTSTEPGTSTATSTGTAEYLIDRNGQPAAGAFRRGRLRRQRGGDPHPARRAAGVAPPRTGSATGPPPAS